MCLLSQNLPRQTSWFGGQHLTACSQKLLTIYDKFHILVHTKFLLNIIGSKSNLSFFFFFLTKKITKVFTPFRFGYTSCTKTLHDKKVFCCDWQSFICSFPCTLFEQFSSLSFSGTPTGVIWSWKRKSFGAACSLRDYPWNKLSLHK